VSRATRTVRLSGWREVVGTLTGVGLPTLAPYTVAIPLDGIRGTEGIEVIGANTKKQIDVPERVGRQV